MYEAIMRLSESVFLYGVSLDSGISVRLNNALLVKLT